MISINFFNKNFFIQRGVNPRPTGWRFDILHSLKCGEDVKYKTSPVQGDFGKTLDHLPAAV
jgi:hypothetical protein